MQATVEKNITAVAIEPAENRLGRTKGAKRWSACPKTQDFLEKRYGKVLLKDVRGCPER